MARVSRRTSGSRSSASSTASTAAVAAAAGPAWAWRSAAGWSRRWAAASGSRPPRTPVPVMVLTAADSEHDKIKAFQLGADDYVTKPFSMVELIARVQVAIRHGQHARSVSSSPLIDAGEVRLDLDARRVTRDGQPVRLTRIEYRLLEVLATNAGRLCSHRFLLEQVWGTGYEEESQYLRVYIANLRKKLDDPAAPHLILTEPGLGYRLVLPPTAATERRQEG